MRNNKKELIRIRNHDYITIKKDNKTTYYNTKLEEIYVEES